MKRMIYITKRSHAGGIIIVLCHYTENHIDYITCMQSRFKIDIAYLNLSPSITDTVALEKDLNVKCLAASQTNSAFLYFGVLHYDLGRILNYWAEGDKFKTNT